MAWTHVGTTLSISAAAESGPSLPVGTAEGDLIVLGAWSNGSAHAASAGYVLAGEHIFSGIESSWWKVAGAAEPAPVMTRTGGSGSYVICSVYRNTGDIGLDAFSQERIDNETATSAPSVNAARNDTLLVHFSLQSGEGSSHTPPTGFTEPTNGDSLAAAISYKLNQAQGATGAIAGELAAVGNGAAQLMAFSIQPEVGLGLSSGMSMSLGISI